MKHSKDLLVVSCLLMLALSQVNCAQPFRLGQDLTNPVPSGLMLRNTLASEDEVLHSAYGPNLAFYNYADCATRGPYCDGFDVKAKLAFLPGKFGSAITIGKSSYKGLVRVHNVVLRNANNILSAERGTVEAWYQQTTVPVGYRYGIYRVFGGDHGLDEGIGFQSLGWNDQTGDPPGFDFSLSFGGSVVFVRSDANAQRGVNLAAYNNTWIHLAGVWDRQGIDGTADTLRLYLNGTKVASSSDRGWGTMVGTTVDIAGGNDAEVAGKFAVCNLKLWNVARTDFSDRSLP